MILNSWKHSNHNEQQQLPLSPAPRKLWPRFVDKVTHQSAAAEVAAQGAGHASAPGGDTHQTEKYLTSELFMRSFVKLVAGPLGRQPQRETERKGERVKETGETSLCPNRICNSMLSLHFCVLAFHLWPPRDLHMNEPKTSQVKSSWVCFGLETRARLGHKVCCSSSSSATFHQMSDELSLRLRSGCRLRLRLQVSPLSLSICLAICVAIRVYVAS